MIATIHTRLGRVSADQTTSTQRTPSLRARKKASAMRHIQAVAIDLFQSRGFAHGTVEQIAEAAEVSPSSIYRYFHTKEGLVMHDEFDDVVFGQAVESIRAGLTPLQVFSAVLESIDKTHVAEKGGQTLARVKLWIETPSVRAGTVDLITEMAEVLRPALVESGYSAQQARVVAVAGLWAVVAALMNWYEDGATGPWAPYLRDASVALAGLDRIGD